MIFTISEFNQEAFEKFSQSVNSLKDGEKLTIFVESGGGSTSTRDMYLKVIEGLQNVELVGAQLCSAAFDLFETANCKKSLLPSSFGMVHHTAWDIALGDKLTPRGDYAKFQYKFQKSQEHSYKWMKEKEKKKYENGDEVWLDYNRLKEIFPNS